MTLWNEVADMLAERFTFEEISTAFPDVRFSFVARIAQWRAGQYPDDTAQRIDSVAARLPY
mgnify:CR=1 FL=1